MTTENKVRLQLVLDEEGRLVGTARPAPVETENGILTVEAVPGPGQRIVDVEVSADLASEEDAAQLHARLRSFL
ncbi:hypothetical protein [Arthrobacter sp. NPDC058192]|uniref:hypothetical protein n=1 Tax=Arthrobacter sp. NPDC058192 TaxID=3346372 RepID=UPI0036E1CE1F